MKSSDDSLVTPQTIIRLRNSELNRRRSRVHRVRRKERTGATTPIREGLNAMRCLIAAEPKRSARPVSGYRKRIVRPPSGDFGPSGNFGSGPLRFKPRTEFTSTTVIAEPYGLRKNARRASDRGPRRRGRVSPARTDGGENRVTAGSRQPTQMKATHERRGERLASLRARKRIAYLTNSDTKSPDSGHLPLSISAGWST